jgi:hypothetical protein
VVETVEFWDISLIERRPAEALNLRALPGTIVGPVLKKMLSFASVSHTQEGLVPSIPRLSSMNKLHRHGVCESQYESSTESCALDRCSKGAGGNSLKRRTGLMRCATTVVMLCQVQVHVCKETCSRHTHKNNQKFG